MCLSVFELGRRQFPNTVIFTPSAICFNAYIESLLVASCCRISLDGKEDDFPVSSQWALLLLKQVRHELTRCLVPTFRVSFDWPATEAETDFLIMLANKCTNPNTCRWYAGFSTGDKCTWNYT